MSELDRHYDVQMNQDKIMVLANKIWDALNEVDYDPMHPNFEHLDDPIKDKIIEFASDLIVPTESL